MIVNAYFLVNSTSVFPKGNFLLIAIYPVSRFLCMLRYFLMITGHFDHYNMASLVVRFYPAPRLVVALCYSCFLFSDFSELIL